VCVKEEVGGTEARSSKFGTELCPDNGVQACLAQGVLIPGPRCPCGSSASLLLSSSFTLSTPVVLGWKSTQPSVPQTDFGVYVTQPLHQTSIREGCPPPKSAVNPLVYY